MDEGMERRDGWKYGKMNGGLHGWINEGMMSE